MTDGADLTFEEVCALLGPAAVAEARRCAEAAPPLPPRLHAELAAVLAPFPAAIGEAA